ncbi:MAG: hypothetical protein GXO07_01440 [Crenarchaeota archaeon]|nr:hypothetical protein [Thermoproteota archaeon]
MDVGCAFATVSAVVSIVVSLVTLFSLALINVTGVANPLVILGGGVLAALASYFLSFALYGVLCG